MQLENDVVTGRRKHCRLSDIEQERPSVELCFFSRSSSKLHRLSLSLSFRFQVKKATESSKLSDAVLWAVSRLMRAVPL
ncbi:hypothetical protein F2Q69_00024564 [Brassica cretica]|uniref:Uncharacterized protein n=1 Tax=Brassica cretica TaxID=69181 RepID=A0A8S9QCV2_BRACR|nr:hypothetical protein F2Q69_00024564 [Brassica cretica]